MTSTRPAPSAPEPDRGPDFHSIRTDAPVLGSFMIEQRQKRIGGALGVSVLVHVAGAALVILLITLSPVPLVTALDENKLPNSIVWLTSPGPGGGGGGGGNKSPEPPRKVELPGKDRLSVPVTKPAALAPPKELKPPPPDPPKAQDLTIPAVQMAAGVQSMPGAIVSNDSISLSQGSGSGTGAGTGRGSGIGSGTGSGLGPGTGGGTGGGAYRPGNGISLPVKLYEQRPNYTPDAMRARIQGVVAVEAVVMPDGTVGQPRVIRSLDSTFGLDTEAIKAVLKWRFKPGVRTATGEPVPTLVVIEVTFTLR